MPAGLSCSKEDSVKVFKGVTLYEIDLLLLICLNLKSLILQYQGNRCLKMMGGRQTK